MKKLLSILSIGGIICGASTNVVSCENDTTNPSETAKENLPVRDKIQLTNAIQNLTKYKDVLNDLVLKLASESSFTEEQISDDIGDGTNGNLIVSMRDGDGLRSLNSLESIFQIDGTNGKVIVTPKENDQYFNQGPITYNLTVDSIKEDVPETLSLNNAIVNSSKYEDVLNDFIIKLAAATSFTEDQIKEDVGDGSNSNILVKMFELNGTEITAGNTFNTPGDGRITAIISSSSPYFNQKQQNYDLTVS